LRLAESEKRTVLDALPSRNKKTGVFLQKSVQTIENKGEGAEKERQEEKRVCKKMKMRNLPQRHRGRRGGEKPWWSIPWVTPRGNADGYQKKGLAGKAIRKNMKIKG
jgi:hypothetical protein